MTMTKTMTMTTNTMTKQELKIVMSGQLHGFAMFKYQIFKCATKPAAIPLKLEAVPLLPTRQLSADVLGHFLLVRRSTRPSKCPYS